jgi:hypothetical protein
MHPIFSRPERLTAYLAAWAAIGGLLTAIFSRLGLPWMAAAALFVPLCLVYAFICLSAWYVCRATPLRTSGVFRVFIASILAAAVGGAMWQVTARVLMNVLITLPPFINQADAYATQLPFLFPVGFLLYIVAIAAHYTLLAAEIAREADRQRLELQVLTRDAELRALRAQVDPHFLFNSLNSISALTGSDAAGARRMCLLLADFLRSTLDVSSRERISLAEELTMATQFLDIEQVRFGRRLAVERRVEEAAVACRVPALILQPLVENAVTHGIAKLVDGGVIRLDVARHNGRVSIVVENPRDPDDRPPRRRGVGLENVRQRLYAAFGSNATMALHSEPGLFRVHLDIPVSD